MVFVLKIIIIKIWKMIDIMFFILLVGYIIFYKSKIKIKENCIISIYLWLLLLYIISCIYLFLMGTCVFYIFKVVHIIINNKNNYR